MYQGFNGVIDYAPDMRLKILVLNPGHSIFFTPNFKH